ncbi:LysE family translocator [Luteimonas sp. WGS1318]|uniref:LysE family translocator n=1 Tax=Luteimonas sp. WGS1318 TaxID=3366815 RepID=UPI00372D5CB1
MDALGFALAVLLVEITPGPNMAWLVSLTLAEGRRVGLAATVGVAVGLALNATLAGFGLSALLLHAPAIGTWIGIAAGLMMLWLAWRGWQVQDEGAASAAVAGHTRHHALVAGVVLNVVNVKAALFFVTVVPRFLSGPDAPAREIVMLGVISVSVATLIHLGLVLGAGRLRQWLIRPDRVLAVRRVLALGMAAVGLWFVHAALR